MLKSKKKITAVFLLAAMLSVAISGCGGSDTGKEGGILSGGEEEPGAGQYAEGTPMGRYVEQQVEFSGSAWLSGNGNGLYQLDNGQIIITDSFSPFLISKDHGANWFEDKRTWRSKMIDEETYILDAAVGGDNTAAVLYQEAAKSPDEEIVLAPELLIVRPDKTEIQAEVTLTEEDVRLTAVYISQEGRIFVTTQSSNIYEVMEDGSSQLFLMAEDGAPELIRFQDSLMFIDGEGYDSLLIYDMEQGEYIEDKVLEDFIKENYADRHGFTGNWHDMFFFGGEDGTLYIAGKMGVYRHVLGGSVMEQVIDGSLSLFSNPSYTIAGMLVLEDNRFLTLFQGGTLVWFTYNPDIPTVPLVQIKVYGLEDNSTIRQAINLYQTTNPEIYVEYEVGMGGSSSVTREDALKSLNTKILAGDGPDILVLDDMPADSYIEKGVLCDLSPIFNNMSGEDELFGNIVDAFREEEKIYMMPCEVQLPVILGRKDQIAAMKDLKTMADGAEQLREEKPGEDIFDRLCTERGIMHLLSTVSEPEWMTEDRTVNREAVSEFLIQAGRIYDAQMDGISDTVLDKYDEWNDFSQEEFGAPWDETDRIRVTIDVLSLMGESSNLQLGAITDPWNYACLTSVPQTKGFEDCEWIPMNGLSDGVFSAKTLVGISASSTHTKEAEEFVKELFGKENQRNQYQGMAVNKAAFQAGFDSEEGETWGSIGRPDDEGIAIVLTVYGPSRQQVDKLWEYMESVKIPYMEDTVLEEAVYEEGVAYMQGTKSIAEAVDSIEKKMAIYLAE